MAGPIIIWRNARPVKRVRTWTPVRRGEQRSLYLVLESGSSTTPSWAGLPTLEVIRGRRAANSDARRTEEAGRGSRIATNLRP